MKRFTLFLLSLCFLTGCSQLNNALISLQTGQIQTLTVLSVSGLGSEPQGLKEIEAEITTNCPTTTLIKSHWNDDLESLLSSKWDTKEPLVIIGHSFGGGRSVYCSQRLNSAKVEVNALFLLDPVPPPAEKPDNSIDFTLPKNVIYAKCWNRDKWQLFVANSKPIQNTNDGNGQWFEVSVNEFHNQVPKDHEIQAEIIAKIQSLAQIQIGVPLPTLKQLFTDDPNAKKVNNK